MRFTTVAPKKPLFGTNYSACTSLICTAGKFFKKSFGSMFFQQAMLLLLMAALSLLAHPVLVGAADLPVSGSVELATGWDFTVTYPSSWSKAPQRFANMIELINIPLDKQGQQEASVRVGITSDSLASNAAALQEIQDLGTGLGAPQTAYISIAGWPAFQYSWVEKREQPNHGPKNPDTFVVRVSTAIAAGNQLIRIEAWLPSDASETLVGEVKAIGRSVSLKGGAAPTDGSIDATPEFGQLTGAVVGEAGTSELSGASWTTTATMVTSASLLPGTSESLDLLPGFEQQIFPDRNGELEIAASPNGQFIVIGRQSWWSYSQDGGQTFTNGGRIPYSNGDPSLAHGLSGNFYYAGIDENDGGGFGSGSPGTGSGQCPGPDGASPLGYSCTNIAISTDNGMTFPTASIVTAVTCPQRDDLDDSGPLSPAAGACFPDQEHIAADRFNPGSGGGDQVYSTWRSFPGGVASIVCSEDSGQNWTAPLVVEMDGRFPRITVGQDGFVYVAYYASGNYRLAKYSSCASGLSLQFRRTVFSQDPIECPFVGHDRCDQNPSSQMVAVDDTNPNHIYYAYAETVGSPDNDRIVVQDSLDGGDNWDLTRRRRVNANIPGKRIMPWICTSGGEAFLTWYDRRNAPSIANDRTDYYGGSASLDHNGDLNVGPDFRINEQADDWCASGWPCSTRDVASAENCSVQPQLAGVCRADCDNPASTDSAVPCDFSDGCAGVPGANAGETCCTGNGCPKYGDYNGNLCVAGRLLAAWASATPAPYIPLPGGTPPPIGILFSEILVGPVPQIQVPGAVTIDTTCVNEIGHGTLEVCNTGNDILEVFSISSSNPQFTVTTPTGEGYPVRVSPDFCFPFQVSFSPTSAGSKSGMLTISSNDPANPSVTVQVSGEGATGDVRVTGSTDFGDICAEEQAEKTVSVCNVGSCNLNVTGASIDCSNFTLVNNPFPAAVSPDSCLDLTIRFTPLSAGSKSCTLDISSDDPDQGTVSLAVTANTPAPVIDVAGDQGFPPTVIQSVGACSSEKPFPIQNNGICPLEIENVYISTNDAEYSLSGLPSVPVKILPGELFGDGDLSALFAPDSLARTTTGQISVIYVTDPITGVTSTVNRELCGEAVHTGARVLVTQGGVPLDEVMRIQIQRIAANRNGNRVDTVDVARNLPLQTVAASGACNGFQYHREYGTVSNPIQLLPGSYQIMVQARIDGRVNQKTAAFDVGTCGFNPTITVDF